MNISEVIRSGDWKVEKHVPVIEAPEKVTLGESFSVILSVGKEIAHPNTTEHHISWIKLYFKPAGNGPVYEVGGLTFDVHAEAVAGANQGPVTADPVGTLTLALKESGTLIALSYCNIHGLWESSKEITVA